MGDVTLRQHYVWRKYLRAWATPKDRICAIIIDKAKIVSVNLMGVAQENSFYKMEVLTNDEITFIQRYIFKLPKVLKGLSNDLLQCYITYRSLSEQQKINSGSSSSIPNIGNELRKIEIDTFEKIHCIIESFGNDLVECSNANELREIVNNEEKYINAMAFICIQYSRTKLMRTRLDESVIERPNIHSVVEKAWPILSLISGFQICCDAIHNRPSFYFVENCTDRPFITGDQPLINSVGDDTNEEGYVKDLVFYYPISPKSAIIIEFGKEHGYTVETIKADDTFVDKYNSLIANNSQQFLFANDVSILETYLK